METAVGKWQMLYQKDQVLVDLTFSDDVQIIQYQNRFFFQCGEIIYKGWKQNFHDGWLGRLETLEDRLANTSPM